MNKKQAFHQLDELCQHCGRRMGLHSMYNQCPGTASNGVILPRQFKAQEFVGTGRYHQQGG